MNLKRTNLTRVAAVGATTTLLGLMTAAPSVAAGDSDVAVANTETVQVYMSATGEPEEQRVYEQLALNGDGTVTVSNPVSTEGLRNLDEFGGFSVDGGNQVAEIEVDGERRLRSVSDFEGELPLDVEVTYLLDGVEVQPGDVVGESGVLEVHYRVRNVTGEMREVSFDDGTGRTVTEQAEVVIPMVGSLTTTLPSSFTDVRSDEANMAGDGRGGTKLSFTMTLFPPIGSDTVEFGYRAEVTDGVVPAATVSALPVNPLESPSFAKGADSLAGGAETGAQLVFGAQTIDENLLKLRDGAGELLAGLIKLREGAAELNAGLAEEAAPGSAQLADGAERLASGLQDARDGGVQLKDGTGAAAAGGQELASGLGDLSAGAGDLSDGLGLLEEGSRELANGFDNPAGQADLVSGSRDLVTGLRQIRDGVNLLAAEDGIPKAAGGAAALEAGIGVILTKIGNVDDPTTLLGGLTALESGLSAEALPGAKLIDGGVGALLSTDPNAPGLPVAKAGVDEVKAGIDDGLSAMNPASLQALGGAIQAALDRESCAADPVCVANLQGALQGVQTLGTEVQGMAGKLKEASDGLGRVSTGLGGAITKVQTQLKPGTEKLVVGLGTAVEGADKLSGGAAELQAGLETQIRPGLQQLVTGLNDAVAGLGQLAPGTQAAAEGAGDLAAGIFTAGTGAGALADGLGTASSGSQELAAGAERADAGGGELASGLLRLDGGMFDLLQGLGLLRDGSGELSDGAGQLADGLGDAADGSSLLADGLGTAAEGAPKLVDGAQRLSDEGMGQLVEAGKKTAADYGLQYATIEAAAERANEEGMAFGAPKGADGATAFTYELAAADGEGSRNLQRGLGALAILTAGAAVAGLRRRFA
jgi:putative membrane protein